MRKMGCLLLLVVAQASLMATVVIPADRTVHAEWSSWNSFVGDDGQTYYSADQWGASDPAALSVSDAPDAHAEDSVSYAAEHCGRQDVMMLQPMGYWTMDFFMPNYAGGKFKEISVEIVYHNLGSAKAILGVEAYINGLELVNGINGPYSMGSQDLGCGWFKEVFQLIVTPNSDYEFVTLGFEKSNCKVGIDSVIIDTVCVPEPATMGLLTLGMLFLKRRK